MGVHRTMSTTTSIAFGNMKVAIVGGSLGGLAAANVFHRLGATVSVFEKSGSTLEHRGSSLGFLDVDLWQRVRGERLVRNGRQASYSDGLFYYGDMWQFLYSGLPEGTVRFGRTVDSLGDNVERPTIDGEVFDLAIIADGGWSTLRGQYFDSERDPEYAGYQIYWARVDASESPGFRRTGYDEWNGIYETVLLPTLKCNGHRMCMGGIFIATPEDEITRPEAGVNRHVDASRASREPEWFLPFVRQHFGHIDNGAIVTCCEAAVRNGKITPTPVFEFAASKTVEGRIVVLGDAAHMCSPRTAAGAHTTLLDAEGLMEAFGSGGDVEQALREYDKGGTQRAKALYGRSRMLSKMLNPKQGAAPSPATLVKPRSK